MSIKDHWENVYSTKEVTRVSWFQVKKKLSLKLICDLKLPKSASIIDIGGGVSTLIDELIHLRFCNLSVLDLSGAALNLNKKRLGEKADKVTWLEADVLDANLPPQQFDLWHDRAVFHFLTSEECKARYVAKVKDSLKSGGYLIIATFAEEGPEKCSDLPVTRYNKAQLIKQFSPDFEIVQSIKEDHLTPAQSVQKFIYCLFRRK